MQLICIDIFGRVLNLMQFQTVKKLRTIFKSKMFGQGCVRCRNTEYQSSLTGSSSFVEKTTTESVTRYEEKIIKKFCIKRRNLEEEYFNEQMKNHFK